MKNSKDLTFKRLRKKNLERLGKIHNKCDVWGPEWWSVCVMGELGEFCNYLKKIKRGSKKMDKEAREYFRKEFADIQIYLDLMAASLEVDLGKATIEKFNEVSDRYNSKIKL